MAGRWTALKMLPLQYLCSRDVYGLLEHHPLDNLVAGGGGEGAGVAEVGSGADLLDDGEDLGG